LLGINGFDALKLMADLDVLFTLIPELVPLKGRYGGTYHIEDVLSHTLTVVKIYLPNLYQSIITIPDRTGTGVVCPFS